MAGKQPRRLSELQRRSHLLQLLLPRCNNRTRVRAVIVTPLAGRLLVDALYSRMVLGFYQVFWAAMARSEFITDAARRRRNGSLAQAAGVIVPS